MRLFQIIIEITWLILGICCVYLGVRTLSAPGNSSVVFFVLAAVAFGMGAFRFLSRRRRERRGTNPR